LQEGLDDGRLLGIFLVAVSGLKVGANDGLTVLQEGLDDGRLLGAVLEVGEPVVRGRLELLRVDGANVISQLHKSSAP